MPASNEWTLLSLKEHQEAIRAADQLALKLLAEEMQRRLTTLNGEHQTLSTMRDTYVLREVYTKDLERLYTERDEARKTSEIARNDALAASAVARRNTVWAVAGLMVALVGWIITLVLHYLPPDMARG